MISSNEKTIFGKVAYLICEEILRGTYQAEDRIPGVRELAVTYEINYNTVIHAMEVLQREEIVYQKRGIGYFVCANAKRKLQKGQREEFLHETLPEVFRRARLLGIDMDQITEVWDEEAEK
ncbi:MAG: GntR family transcriptional regulator [Bacteroidales bacterium]|nr:GntR family transcriptional regulator [Bacteroidales bacterium]